MGTSPYRPRQRCTLQCFAQFDDQYLAQFGFTSGIYFEVTGSHPNQMTRRPRVIAARKRR